MSLLNISGRTHIIPEKQRNKDTGIGEKGRNSNFAVLDICVAEKAFHSHAAAAAAAAQARRAGEGEAAGWSEQAIMP